MSSILFDFMTKDILSDYSNEKFTGIDKFFAGMGLHELKTIHNVGYSIMFPEGRRDTGVVHIPDILYDEIKDIYHELCKKYGREKIDALLVRDTSVMQKKIMSVINLLMTDVFKVDEINVLFFVNPMVKSLTPIVDRQDSIDKVIYSTLQKNFIISSHSIPSNGNLASIKIKKRSSDQNGNNAS